MFVAPPALHTYGQDHGNTGHRILFQMPPGLHSFVLAMRKGVFGALHQLMDFPSRFGTQFRIDTPSILLMAGDYGDQSTAAGKDDAANTGAALGPMPRGGRAGACGPEWCVPRLAYRSARVQNTTPVCSQLTNGPSRYRWCCAGLADSASCTFTASHPGAGLHSTTAPADGRHWRANDRGNLWGLYAGHALEG
ncbi:unnamed protein product [Ostreobium quekettii]|uniref:Uncharacterized protein n=1 Tax=Ostreobium quekettii TaxID=121088 RepID=A0A8S1J8N8_9CHLO|nr:unnamed protein product [Ostreobium quekettii]